VEKIIKDAHKKHYPKQKEACTPKEAIEELNQNYAVSLAEGDCVIIRENFNHELGFKQVSFMKKGGMNTYFANRSVAIPDGNGGMNFVKLFNFWLQAENRRQYEGVAFNPSEEGEKNGLYNLWQGWGVEEDSNTSCDLFLAHVKDIICNGDEGLNKYLLAWMAHGVQCPDEKPGVAIVMRGGEGIGKGFFAEYYGKIFGPHYKQIIHQHHLTGNFNYFMKDCIVLFADEAVWGGDRKHEGILKGLITEKHLMVEPKGVNAFQVRSCSRLIMASNSEWVVPAGEQARRYLVLDVPDYKKAHVNYWEALEKEKEEGGPEALLHFLKNHNYSDINIRNVPKTDALLDQKFRSLKGFARFWYDHLSYGHLRPKIPAEDDDWALPEVGDRSWIHVKELYEEYIEWGKSSQRHYESISTQEMGMTLRKLCPDVIRSNKRLEYYYESYSSNDERIKKKSGKAYGFPPLDKCRIDFLKILGQKVRWEKFDKDPDAEEGCQKLLNNGEEEDKF